DRNTNGTMFADFIKPEYTYIYSEEDINYDEKTLAVEFTITDKYFASSSALTNAQNITVTMLDDADAPVNTAVTKNITKVEDVTDAEGKKIGEKYRLVIGNLEQATAAIGKNYNDYSGPMSITFPAGMAADNSGNESIEKT